MSNCNNQTRNTAGALILKSLIERRLNGQQYAGKKLQKTIFRIKYKVVKTHTWVLVTVAIKLSAPMGAHKLDRSIKIELIHNLIHRETHIFQYDGQISGLHITQRTLWGWIIKHWQNCFILFSAFLKERTDERATFLAICVLWPEAKLWLYWGTKCRLGKRYDWATDPHSP